jgi:hypothetical protein
MEWYRIKDYYAYIDDAQEQNYWKTFLADYFMKKGLENTALEQIKAKLDKKVKVKFNKYVKMLLENELKRSKEAFLNKYVYFDYKGFDSKYFAKKTLEFYLKLYKRGAIEDSYFDDPEKDIKYCLFELKIKTESSKWRPFLTKPVFNSIFISDQHIYHTVGHIQDFLILSNDFVLDCKPTFMRLYPASEKAHWQPMREGLIIDSGQSGPKLF